MNPSDNIDKQIMDLVNKTILVSRLYIIVSSIGIDFKGIFRGFENLEKLTGSLPVFRIPDYIGEEHKKPLLLFRLQEIQVQKSYFLDLLRAPFTMSDADKEQDYVITPKLLSNLLKHPVKILIANYLEYFELLFNNVIVPIIEEIGPPVSRKRFRHSYNFQIKEFRMILEKNNLKEKLDFFFMNLDGTLRNALVHNNYYLDEEKIYYYQYNPKKKELEEHVKTKKEFVEIMVSIMPLKLFFNIIVGLRLTGMTSKQLFPVDNH